MKTIVRNIFAVAALAMCSTMSYAQGIKIFTKGNAEPITIQAADLDRIETFEAEGGAAATDPAIAGTWAVSKLVTDRAEMDAAWGGMVDYTNFVEFNAEDELTFQDGKIIPNLKSDLKNFFVGECTAEPVEDYVLKGMTKKTLKVLKLTGVNRYFSASEQSESNVAYIGYELVEDDDADEAGVMILNLYLIDYESHAWGPELLDFGMYEPMADAPYVAAMSGVYLQYQLRKK